MTVNVTGTNGTTVTFYLYVNDPAFAGGTLTLQQTTAPSVLTSAAGTVLVGSCAVVFPSSGSGSGGGHGGGGGFPPP